MCGIAGLIDFNGDARRYMDTYEQMLNVMGHRGPDEGGTFLSENACLVHTRLSVVDVENGKQPMTRSVLGKDLTMVYNGELYNTEDIRYKLKNLGHAFEERSDTEVLLHSYMEWGENCVEQLNGIYAFAIWDGRTKTLFAARDRMGVKPFFYSTEGGQFVFGSEIKILLTRPDICPEIGMDGICELFLIGPGRTPGFGVFRGIKELKPGYSLTFSRNGLNVDQYWKIIAQKHTEDFDETVAHTSFLIKDAIKRQTVSDVPLCSFLSGGLDSSAIAALSGVRKTFSVDYSENDKYFKPTAFQPNSDSQFIGTMSDFLGTKHTNIVVGTEELVDALFESVLARDLPGMADVDSSLLLFCRQVKKEATVALSGECADEIFGGYPWYRNEKVLNAPGFPWSQSTQYKASFMCSEFRHAIDPQKYVMDRCNSTINDTDGVLNEPAKEKRMREMFRLNTDWFMQTLLDRKDRMSMWSGLEVRVPFCDHRIAQYLYNVPWEYKNYEDREKGLLRQALTEVLPDEILWRKKSPFPKTHNPKYLSLVSSLLRDVISSPSARLLEIVDKEAILKLLDGGENSNPWYGQLMTVPQTIAYFLQLNYWLETYKVRISPKAEFCYH